MEDADLAIELDYNPKIPLKTTFQQVFGCCEQNVKLFGADHIVFVVC